MKRKNPDKYTPGAEAGYLSRGDQGAFTLIELLVVLAILAALTTVALRSVDGVVDERRWDAARTGLENVEDAVLGGDGADSAGGFVADMGRLPWTTGTDPLELGELWQNPGAAYDIRPALAAHGVPAGLEDSQVLVAGGWRGPYLRLRGGATTLLDGWGNPVTSPASASPPDPLATGYARLRTAADAPINTPGQEVRRIRIPGANGRADAADSGYDRDLTVTFGDERFRAALSGSVEVLEPDTDGKLVPVTPTGGVISVRLFLPDPANAAQIKVIEAGGSFTTNPLTWTIPLSAGAVIGEHSVRAYLLPAAGAAPQRVSSVRHVKLQPGANLVNLTIDRARLVAPLTP